MARRSKSVTQLSSAELYELARQRQLEEQEAADATKQQVAELKKERKQLVNEHKKALAAIDREIDQLQGKRSASRKRGGRRGGQSRGELPAKALEMIAARGPIRSRDLKQLLDEEGLDTTYLAQCLAGLKKKGQVETPERGVYQAA